jgi:hypothetical protein
MFSSASIRLIPKKGDTKLLKNWRSISLLNVGFKIISKAINNRLKKMSDVILSRAQKSFTNKRNIQECLINIINSIEHCESSKLPAFVLALDMAKAFDTVTHDFMDLVYKFFGIGNNMINMIKTVSTGRTASIILEDGSLSKPITLGTGFPQGNPPSPNQFNFGAQILIFKIELSSEIVPIIPGPERPLRNIEVDPEGVGAVRALVPVPTVPVPALVPIPVPVPVPVPADNIEQLRFNNHNLYGKKECNRETSKLEAFADDNTVIGRLTANGITSIKLILLNFGNISGLKCNVD